MNERYDELMTQANSAFKTWFSKTDFANIKGRDYLFAAGISFLMTLVFFTFVNTWTLSRLGYQYNYAKLQEAVDAGSSSDFIDNLLAEEIITDEDKEDYLSCMAENYQQPAFTQLSHLADSVASLSDEREKIARNNKIRRIALGKLSGWRCFWLRATVPTGEELIKSYEQDGGRFKTLLSSKANPIQSRKSLVAFADKSVNLVQPQIRSLLRFNGTIQWLIFFLFFAVLVLCVQRFALLRTIQRQGSSLQLPPMEAMESELSSGVHQPLTFILGLIPSLGFIGTVLGMGEALLASDMLFASSNRQAAISNITQKLGFAFDTTLIALVVSAIGTILLVVLQYHERKIYDVDEAELAETPRLPEPSVDSMEVTV